MSKRKRNRSSFHEYVGKRLKNDSEFAKEFHHACETMQAREITAYNAKSTGHEYLAKCLMEHPKLRLELQALRDQMRLGRELRNLRRNAGLTQVKLAAIAGLPVKDLRELENGTAEITVLSLMQIVGALGKRLRLNFI